MTKKEGVAAESKPVVIKTTEKVSPRIYIGPSLKGVLTGTVYKTDLTPNLEAAVKKAPFIAELIVPLEHLTETNREFSDPDSALSRIYRMAEEYKRGE